MLYSEFIENVGCIDNVSNRELFNNLETMYMNCDIDKATVYEYGRKLADNTPAPEMVKLRQSLMDEIASYKEQIEKLKADIDVYERAAEEDSDYYWQMMIANRRADIRYCRNKIKELRWVLG